MFMLRLRLFNFRDSALCRLKVDLTFCLSSGHGLISFDPVVAGDESVEIAYWNEPLGFEAEAQATSMIGATLFGAVGANS